MELDKAIMQRRSVRKYQKRKVEKEKIKDIIEAGRYAPSHMNMQPWRFVSLDEPEKVAELSLEIRKKMRRALKFFPFLKWFVPTLRNEKLAREFKNLVKAKKDLIFYEAPCLVFVVCPKKYGEMGIIDCSLAAQNMMLAAFSLELGSCWIGFAQEVMKRDRNMKEKYGIKKEERIGAVLIFGYPQVQSQKAPVRKEQEDLIVWLDKEKEE